MNFRHTIRFCDRCGHAVRHAVPADGDTRVRAICEHCATVHYQNPLNVVGTIPVLPDGRILLCKRNIEPRKGMWTLPAGFMELDETLSEGAARETDEEAGADILMGRLFSVISVPRVGQVHFFYTAEVRSEILHPGPETQEAHFFPENDIPWDQIAFRTVSVTLQRYLEDRRTNALRVHTIDLS